MHLEGSCHCGAVRFSLEAQAPVPYLRCHCSICRKTAGSGGYGINLGGDYRTMKVKGAKNLGVYRALLREPGKRTKRSPARRHFCLRCGSPLWLWDPRWPDAVYPHASAIDTPLPRPPEVVDAGLDWAASWAKPPRLPGHRRCGGWPAESLEEWHRRHGLPGGGKGRR